jgi:alpha-tubulin suppressor-like RCC1 family protein
VSILVAVLALLGGLFAAAAPQSGAAEVFSGVVQADGGGSHTCAVRSDGTVWCWGAGDWGELGDGTAAPSSYPVQVSGLTAVTQVAAGSVHTCALRKDGTVWCFGAEFDSVSHVHARLLPVQVAGLTGVIQISAGTYHTCAVRSDHTVWCWGLDNYGQLGDGATNTFRTQPVKVVGLPPALQTKGGDMHTCARLTDDTVRCWGENTSGQLGDGTTTNRTQPVKVKGLVGKVTTLAASGFDTCARRADGSVWCWGGNAQGAIGDGTTVQRLTATRSRMVGAAGVNVGWEYACARTTSGSLDCWGRNEHGQLGNGTIQDAHVPVLVVDLAKVKYAALGDYHGCAVLLDTTMRCWGWNLDGDLGDGTTTDRLTPVAVLAAP